MSDPIPNPAASSGEITVTDSTGRVLVVKPLDALGQLDLFEAAGENSGNHVWLGMAMLACSVQSIDGTPIPMPNSRQTIRGAVKRLGDAGLAAVRQALATTGGADDDPTGAATLAAAGN